MSIIRATSRSVECLFSSFEKQKQNTKYKKLMKALPGNSRNISCHLKKIMANNKTPISHQLYNGSSGRDGE